MDRHRFHADPDPDPNSYVDADPDPDPDQHQHQNDADPHAGWKTEYFFLFFVTALPVYNVLSFSSVSNVP